MKAWLLPIRLLGRIGYVIVAWALVALVFVQVFHAGSAVLVDVGNWSAHRNLGSLVSLPVMAMGALSLVGWLPIRLAGALQSRPPGAGKTGPRRSVLRGPISILSRHGATRCA